MIKTKAIFGNGMLQPLQPLPLKEQQTVQLTIEESARPLDAMTDWEYMEQCLSDAGEPVSLEEVRTLLKTIPGQVSDAVCQLREESRY
jgi:predicted DNA-binding antitoxin AbrB/MazE fold protein